MDIYDTAVPNTTDLCKAEFSIENIQRIRFPGKCKCYLLVNTDVLQICSDKGNPPPDPNASSSFFIVRNACVGEV